ncbi:YbjC family protein [Serratia fonticola]|uniref:YbjC family protein n=1 Tax=Serratia fonticola TaxID=47917 RepID=UPI0020972E87|nr:YbjC family protein [Serratia fonticola]MCO7509790.1 YbjC family protein [Serratia fonticola]
MRSFGDLPRSVLVLEGLGMVLLILSYLSIHDYVRLPGMLASQPAAVGMIFLGVFMMVPAAAFLVWRVVQGLSPLVRGGQPPQNDRRTPPKDKQDQGPQN